MDTPERSMVGGGGTPLSNKFEDSPVFNFLNNLSPIQPVKSTVQAYQPLSYALFTSPHTNPPKAPRPPIRNDSTEASKTEILPTNHGVQSSTQKPVTSPENSTKFPSQESNKPIVFDSGSPDHNTTYNRAFKTSFRVDDVSKGPVQRKSLFASETSTGHKDDDVAECDWEYLLSGNPEDLLLCDPSSDEETGDSISDPVLINNTQPNGVEDCDVHVDHMSYKLETQQQRGMRRRCLVFDPSISISSSSSSRGKMVSQSPLKPKKKAPVLSSLPGIGLHLNSLTAPSNNMMSIQACSVQMSQPKLLTIENNLDSTSENMHEELALAIVPLDSTDPSSNSPKKRRKKVESGDGEACKRCSCKKSKCLKLYCECFAAGVYCSEPCACQGCYNKPIHEETVLSTRKQIEFRNPLAFAPKVIRALDSVQEIREDFNNTPASARHKRGCNCKKSSCLKKYCECFQGGVGCSLSCRCDSCKNTFGRREDALPMVGEEINGCDEEETQEIENSSAQSLEDLDPTTPRFEALGTRMKPSRPLNISSHSLLKCREDESPDLFVNENSGIGGVMKTSSPNGKRVSPPQTGKLVPPIYKGGRKLILRSIPSLSRNTFNDCFINNPNSGTSFDSSRLTGGL